MNRIDRFTMNFGACYPMMEEYADALINHAEGQVEGDIHTNAIESFWSCLKRAIGGTYVSVEPFHLFPDLDEQLYRYKSQPQGQPD